MPVSSAPTSYLSKRFWIFFINHSPFSQIFSRTFSLSMISMVLRAATKASLLGKKVEDMNSLLSAAIITSFFPVTTDIGYPLPIAFPRTVRSGVTPYSS